jgi:hypothetical protein
MFKKTSIYICFVVLFTCFLVQGSMAQDVVITLEAVQTAPSEPVLIDGDPTQIAGFKFVQDILLDGIPIGTASGTTLLSDPPLNLADQFIFGEYQTTVTITNLGTFEESGYIVALTNSTTVGEVWLSLNGSVSNGTGALTGIYGVATGMGSTNIFVSQGSSIEQIYRLRLGY